MGSTMYETSEYHKKTCNKQIDTSLGNMLLYGAGSDLIKSELGAYGEKVLGSSSSYVQNNIGRYISNPQYYFQVNEDYVKNKLKVILFPFLHKGHWMRAGDMVGGEFSFKPPIYDINAPDLYIPMMAFGTYLVLAGYFLGITTKFSPEALGVPFTTGLLCWLLQILLLEATLHSLGSGEVPLLDIVAYGGYIFVNASIILLCRIIWDYAFYFVTIFECFCMGVFLIKTMKRILIGEVRSFEKPSTKRNYLLLLMALSQIPLLFWLGNVGVGAK
ncbi:protein YIF1B-like [Solanum tuberosum]|uniref:protein YIF1B-like n=1 Tax=Solanum tuberosum TaxID=4113 RepID=UPI0003D28B0F|nr:PREDICTED: protein YIF1B-like [Solanum tuberosum]